MQIEQQLTLRLQGEDIGALRMLLAALPSELRGGMMVPYPGGITMPTDPDAGKRLAQRLISAVSGGL